MLIGYARVSTLEQNLDLQEDALKAAGCQKVYTDKTSGTKAERAGLERALADVRPGDSLVVWKLDRLGRSLKHLIETVTDLGHRGVGFRSLQEAIDTTTSGGKLIFHVFGALAEFERDIIRERTLAGLAAARARGRKGGRPRNLDDKKKRHAATLHSAPTNSVQDICRTLGISKATLYRIWPSNDANDRTGTEDPIGDVWLSSKLDDLRLVSAPMLLDPLEPDMESYTIRLPARYSLGGRRVERVEAVDNARSRHRKARPPGVEDSPSAAPTLTPAIYPLEEERTNMMDVRAEARSVLTNTVVLNMSGKMLPQIEHHLSYTG